MRRSFDDIYDFDLGDPDTGDLIFKIPTHEVCTQSDVQKAGQCSADPVLGAICS